MEISDIPTIISANSKINVTQDVKSLESNNTNIEQAHFNMHIIFNKLNVLGKFLFKTVELLCNI